MTAPSALAAGQPGTAAGDAPPHRARPAQLAAGRPRPAALGRAGLFVWVPVLMAAGIGLSLTWPGLAAAAGLGVAVPMAMLAGLAPRWVTAGRFHWRVGEALRLAALAVMLIGAGQALMAWRTHSMTAPVLTWRYYGPAEGRLIGIDRSARDRIRLTLDQVVLRDTEPSRTPARVRVSLNAPDPGDPLPPLGQRVMLTAHLGPPPGPAAPGSFDFRTHAWYLRLGAVGYSRTPVMTVAPPPGGIWRAHRARMALSAAMQDRIGGQKGAVAAALMTGDRSGIAESTNEMMRAANLYHIVSISGLHMAMLAGFVYGGLRLILTLARGLGLRTRAPVHKLAAGAALAAAAGYLWLSGGGVATERAFIMVAVMLGAILVDRRAASLRTVALAGAIILVLSPEAVATPGFQMSFAATVALILSAGPWARVAPHLPGWLRPVAMLVLSSLVAGLATSPIAAAHFNRMSQYGLLANLLAVPVMGSVVMPAGVIAGVLAPVGLAAPALWVMGVGTGWMLIVARRVADLGGAVTALPQPPAQVLPLMCFGAALLVLCWRRGQTGRVWDLPGAGWAAGLAMVAMSGALWASGERPLLLIAPEGEAVGLMTPAGRALSKPAGGAFVTETWLTEDGDTATPAASAARPAWSGDRRDRRAALPDGWEVWHFTGKGAAARAAGACRGRRIVILTEPAAPESRGDCLLFDLRRLRQTGAVAIRWSGGPVIRTAAEDRSPMAPQPARKRSGPGHGHGDGHGDGDGDGG